MSESDREAISKLPGCGLASYATVLMVMGLAGIAGVAGSAWVLIAQGDPRRSELIRGTDVQQPRLQPMRDAGVLEADEVPAAWHDESVGGDGTVACALTGTGIVRVSAGRGASLAYGEVQEVVVTAKGAGVAVHARGASGDLVCTFAEGEGGDRFERQVRAEVARAATHGRTP